jgi:CspA family cold shock protein
MAHGTVKWFNADKGFGFIEDAQGGPDIYVHYTGITRTADGREDGWRELPNGAYVEYDVNPNGHRGPQAENVRVLSST